MWRLCVYPAHSSPATWDAGLRGPSDRLCTFSGRGESSTECQGWGPGAAAAGDSERHDLISQVPVKRSVLPSVTLQAFSTDGSRTQAPPPPAAQPPPLPPGCSDFPKENFPVISLLSSWKDADQRQSLTYPHRGIFLQEASAGSEAWNFSASVSRLTWELDEQFPNVSTPPLQRWQFQMSGSCQASRLVLKPLSRGTRGKLTFC